MNHSFDQRATVLKHKAEEIAKKLLMADVPAPNFIKQEPRIYPKSNDPSEYRLFVKNLRPETTEETLKAYFGRWGKVVDVYIRQSQYRFHGHHCNMGKAIALMSFTKIAQLSPRLQLTSRSNRS